MRNRVGEDADRERKRERREKARVDFSKLRKEIGRAHV